MATEDEGQQGEQPGIEQAGIDIDIKPEPQEGEGGDAGEAAAGGKPSRKERRDDKARGWAQENAELKRRLDASEREAAEGRRTREEMAELRGRFEQAEKTRTQGTQTVDEKRLDQIETEMEDAVIEMGKGIDGARQRWKDLRREEARIVARIEASGIAREAEERVRKDIPQRGDPRLEALSVDFPQLAGADEKSLAFKQVANGHVHRLVITEGRDMTNPEVRYQTLREGAELASKDLNIPSRRRAPTEVERERLSGTSGRDSGAGNGATRVSLSPAQAGLARALYPTLSPEQAYVKWWKEIGVRAQNKA